MYCCQVLAALACDLSLDSLPHMSSAATWAWFRGYCVAARVLAWLQQQSPMATLPTSFRDEVQKRIQELSGEDERADRRHEDGELFHREQDEELILWLNSLAGMKFIHVVHRVGPYVEHHH